MSYDTLDAIADSYNPILFILYLAYSAWYWYKNDKTAWVRGLIGIAACYVLMAIDNKFGIWESQGLDYSTHTAVAVALLSFHIHKRSLTSIDAMTFKASFLSYLALMWYQEYHTIVDMVSTLFVVGAVLLLIYSFKRSNQIPAN